MSVFGKILLVMNLIGAAALAWFAVQVYSKRQVGEYAALAYELELRGLPIDEEDLDEQGLPLVNRLADPDDPAQPSAILTYLFSSVGGNPVRTQVEEVKQLQGRVEEKLAATKGQPIAGGYALAEFLLPFAESTIENDQYVAARAHLADAKAYEALLKRYQDARDVAVGILKDEEENAKDAVKRGLKKPTPRPVDDAFRLAFRAQPGLPATWITHHIARSLPPTLAELENVKSDQIKTKFDAALTAQLAQFDASKDQLFADATVKVADKKATRDTQRANIARLLFGLSQYAPLAKDEQTRTTMLGRLLVISGIQVGRGAITQRSQIVRDLELASEQVAEEERAAFLRDQSSQLEFARDRATQVRVAQRDLGDVQADIAQQKANLEKKEGPMGDVAKAQKKYADAVARSLEALTDLQRISAKLLEDRTKARDMIGLMQEREKRIQELEKQIIQAQQKKPR
jgi:hypothetical protein